MPRIPQVLAPGRVDVVPGAPRQDPVELGALATVGVRGFGRALETVGDVAGTIATRLGELERRKRDAWVDAAAEQHATQYSLALRDEELQLERNPDPPNHATRAEQAASRRRETILRSAPDDDLKAAIMKKTQHHYEAFVLKAKSRGDAMLVDTGRAMTEQTYEDNMRAASATTDPILQSFHKQDAERALTGATARGLYTQQEANKIREKGTLDFARGQAAMEMARSPISAAADLYAGAAPYHVLPTSERLGLAHKSHQDWLATQDRIDRKQKEWEAKVADEHAKVVQDHLLVRDWEGARVAVGRARDNMTATQREHLLDRIDQAEKRAGQFPSDPRTKYDLFNRTWGADGLRKPAAILSEAQFAHAAGRLNDDDYKTISGHLQTRVGALENQQQAALNRAESQQIALNSHRSTRAREQITRNTTQMEGIMSGWLTQRANAVRDDWMAELDRVDPALLKPGDKRAMDPVAFVDATRARYVSRLDLIAQERQKILEENLGSFRSMDDLRNARPRFPSEDAFLRHVRMLDEYQSILKYRLSNKGGGTPGPSGGGSGVKPPPAAGTNPYGH